ncbi:hypothetical protein ST47_g6849 [Ascochyta rabiei]|uniref:Uncharacterized protein n=1 Tax=Didymella rabiei TaxID=5454 RepID=A0A163BUJ1_DIDRA|nr:hypothetical protein ST47_g6849 [Ascochyta rabiei]
MACTPTQSQWDFSIQGACWSPWILIYYAIVAGTISAVVDLYLAVYPAVVLYRLHINWKKKTVLSVALGLGSIAAVVAMYKSTRLPALASEDFSYDTADITVWTSIEGNCIIVAACIPTLQPLLDRAFGRKTFGSNGDGYKSHGKHKVELATIGSRGRKIARSHKKIGVSDTTLGRDSLDSILSSEHQPTGNQSSKLEHNHGIMRTHRVTVAYE